MTWGTEETTEARAHVLALATRLRAEVYWTDDPLEWQAYEGFRQAWVPHPTGVLHYLVALHELGHIASRVARRWRSRYDEPGGGVLVEGAAWAWAAQEAIPHLVGHASTEEWSEVVTRFFGGYLWNAAMVEPPAVGQQVRL